MPTKEDQLASLLAPDAALRRVEAHIFAVGPDTEGSTYDTSFGTLYDWVACNPIYNRLVWGYSTEVYHALARQSFDAAGQGWMLDAGCGSLAFTAEVYAARQRPVVLVDNSIKLLRMAKARMVKRCGAVPETMFFLCCDATALPFQSGVFGSVLSLNLLHVLADPGKLLRGLAETLTPGGALACTTLVRCGRWADGYLRMCEKQDEVVCRTVPEVLALFDAAHLSATPAVHGSLAVLSCEKETP